MSGTEFKGEVTPPSWANSSLDWIKLYFHERIQWEWWYICDNVQIVHHNGKKRISCIDNKSEKVKIKKMKMEKKAVNKKTVRKKKWERRGKWVLKEEPREFLSNREGIKIRPMRQTKHPRALFRVLSHHKCLPLSDYGNHDTGSRGWQRVGHHLHGQPQHGRLPLAISLGQIRKSKAFWRWHISHEFGQIVHDKGCNIWW